MIIGTPSLLSQPTKFSPGYNENWFQLNSASASSIAGFKYVYKLYTYDQSSGSQLGEFGKFVVPSRPNTYDGLWSAKNVLVTQLGANFQPGITQSTKAEDSIVRYRVAYGLQCNPGLTFSDTQYQFSPYLGQLGLTFSTHHDLKVGDEITISMNNKQLNPQYNATASVVNINNPYEIVTNLSFGSGSSNEGGAITNLTRYTGTSSTLYSFNGTRQYDERQTDFYTYSIGYAVTLGATGIGKILSEYVGYKTIFLDQNETISILTDKGAFLIDYTNTVVTTYNTSNTLLNTYTFSYTVPGDYHRADIPTGTKNLTSMGVSFTGVDNYLISLKGSTGITYATFKYRIVPNCSIYPNVRILWLNRYGGVDYFNFNKDNKKVTEVDRTEIRTALDWNYSIGDRELYTLSAEATETYTLNSDLITENEAKYLEWLVVKSKLAYIEVGPHLYPIQLIDKQFELKTSLRNQAFNCVITYKPAYGINLQNG